MMTDVSTIKILKVFACALFATTCAVVVWEDNLEKYFKPNQYEVVGGSGNDGRRLENPSMLNVYWQGLIWHHDHLGNLLVEMDARVDFDEDFDMGTETSAIRAITSGVVANYLRLSETYQFEPSIDTDSLDTLIDSTYIPIDIYLAGGVRSSMMFELWDAYFDIQEILDEYYIAPAPTPEPTFIV